MKKPGFFDVQTVHPESTRQFVTKFQVVSLNTSIPVGQRCFGLFPTVAHWVEHSFSRVLFSRSLPSCPSSVARQVESVCLLSQRSILDGIAHWLNCGARRTTGNLE